MDTNALHGRNAQCRARGRRVARLASPSDTAKGVSAANRKDGVASGETLCCSLRQLCPASSAAAGARCHPVRVCVHRVTVTGPSRLHARQRLTQSARLWHSTNLERAAKKTACVLGKIRNARSDHNQRRKDARRSSCIETGIEGNEPIGRGLRCERVIGKAQRNGRSSNRGESCEQLIATGSIRFTTRSPKVPPKVAAATFGPLAGYTRGQIVPLMQSATRKVTYNGRHSRHEDVPEGVHQGLAHRA